MDNPIFQQFTGAMSEVAHSITKLIIYKNDRPPGGKGGIGSQILDTGLKMAGVDSVVGNITTAIKGEERFEVQINPEKYELSSSINYDAAPAQGEQAATQRFANTAAQELVLTFTLDGTGVVPGSLSDMTNLGLQNLHKIAGTTDVSYVTKRIEALKKIVYNYNSETHQPSPVVIVWGDIPPFKGRLTKMEVSFTLFHPSGIPLRADIKLSFSEHIPQPASGTGTPGSSSDDSPDLTHRRTVKQSDTLLLMTESIYGDASYYWQVAKENRLTHFRELKPYTNLFFPPLDRSTSQQ